MKRITTPIIYVLTIAILFNQNLQADQITECLVKIYKTAHRSVNRTVKSSSFKTVNQTDSEISVLSPEYANELFQRMAENRRLPFLCAKSGCEARAHVMTEMLESVDVISGKVFVEGALYPKPKHSIWPIDDGWGFHVAPIVKVKIGGAEKIVVLDPSLFDHPVSVNEWISVQKHGEGSEIDRFFFTNRFNYLPENKTTEINYYTRQNSEAAQEVLRSWREANDARIRFLDQYNLN